MSYLAKFIKTHNIRCPNLERLLASVRLDDRWVTMNGARVLLGDDGEVKGGLGGKYTGQNVSSVGKAGASKSISDKDAQRAEMASSLNKATTAQERAFANYEQVQQEYIEARSNAKRAVTQNAVKKGR